MPTNLPDQNWTVPSGTDLADNPLAFTDFATDVQQTVILRYPNTATRDAFNGSRVAGDISFTTGRTWYDRWTGTKWLPVTPIQVFKTVAQTVNNTTVLVNDTQLTVPLPTANSRYTYQLGARYDSATAADIKWGLAIPVGAVATMGGPALDTLAGAATGSAFFGEQVTPATLASGGAGVGTNLLVIVSGIIQTAAATGNVTVQFAQNTANLSNTTMAGFSWLSVWGLD